MQSNLEKESNLSTLTNLSTGGDGNQAFSTMQQTAKMQSDP
jgi:hypothetical protein